MRDIPPPFLPDTLVAEFEQAADCKLLDALPSVLEALYLAYALGHQTEEGRECRAAFLISTNPPSSEKRLVSPVDSFSDVVALAAATDPDRMCLRLEPGEDGKLRVVSLVPRRPPGQREEELLQVALQRFIVEVNGPTNFSLHVGRFNVYYDRGRYFVADPQREISSLMPKGISDALIAECSGQPPRREWREVLHGIGEFDEAHHLAHQEQLLSVLATGGPLVASDTAYFIAAYANRFRHGATLLLTDSTEPLQALQPRFVLDACAGSSRDWNAGALDYLWWTSVVLLAQHGVNVLTSCDVAELREWTASEGAFSVFRAREAWHRDAKNAARLSQIDGVTVFDAQVRPYILGGHVADVDIAKLPNEWRASLEKRGSRHKSGAYLAYKNPGTLCIVVSQDGTLSAFSCDPDGKPKSYQINA